MDECSKLIMVVQTCPIVTILYVSHSATIQTQFSGVGDVGQDNTFVRSSSYYVPWYVVENSCVGSCENVQVV